MLALGISYLQMRDWSWHARWFAATEEFDGNSSRLAIKP